MQRFAAVASLTAACQAAVLPEAFLGTWSPVNHSTVHAILGPVPVPHITVTKDETNGDYWMSAIPGQVFRIRDDLMQYCFLRVATSPFVVETVEENRVVFCYHTGMRMTTHKESKTGLATGCDAAQMVLELRSDGTLEFTFYMSPPVKHAWAVYERTGEPPPVSSYYLADLGDACDPKKPGPPTLAFAGASGLTSMCPATTKIKEQVAATATVLTDDAACRQLDAGAWFLNATEKVDIRLQYTMPKDVCWPCNVSYSVSAAISEDEYIGFGFKGMAYRAMLEELRPNYFGMSTDEVDETRTSRVMVLGYAASSGGCVREMKSESYVGAPSDVQGNPHLFQESVERTNGRTVVRFTVEQHVGRNGTEIDSFFNADEMSARTMWAIGAVSGNDCDAQLQFHTARGLSPLSWFRQNPSCTVDPVELGAPLEHSTKFNAVV